VVQSDTENIGKFVRCERFCGIFSDFRSFPSLRRGFDSLHRLHDFNGLDDDGRSVWANLGQIQKGRVFGSPKSLQQREKWRLRHFFFQLGGRLSSNLSRSRQAPTTHAVRAIRLASAAGFEAEVGASDLIGILINKQ
jgi:hypothetical protein